MSQPSIPRGRPQEVRWTRRRLSALVAALTALPLLAQAELNTAADAAPSATQVVVGAAADARVLEANPTTNYGSLARLDVDNPGQQSHLRFNVSGVSGAVQRATLRLFVRNGSSNGPSLYRTGAAWTEATITWNNRPPATSGAIANVGTATAGTWSEYDLTGQVTGNGTHDFVLLPDSTDGIQYDSREGASPPQLVLEIGEGGSVNAPPVAVDDTATTLANTAVDINVAANDTDPDGNLAPTSATTTCTGCTTPANGALVNNGDGTFRYTPDTDFTGTNSFTYQICDTLASCDTATVTVTTTPPGGTQTQVFVGAGDIADCSRSSDDATAQLLDNIPGTVFTIGDNAYPSGSAASFTNCYGPTWGRQKARTHPTAGDNDYDTPGAAPYFSYFGAAAGDPARGYYSYDLGAWHIIHLNSECSKVGGCRPTSPQGQWLRADLAANPRACILALHHEPLFSSKGGDSDLRDFWDPLYAAGADVVLSGHRHNYERFARQTPTAVADPQRGIRQFVVGTGGSSLSSFSSTIAANSEVRNDRTHGVLKLTLHPTSYDWEFVPIAGQTFTDSGSASCTSS
jgi:Bacterial Ig domain